MNKIIALLGFMIILFPPIVLADSGHGHMSEYVGQEKRPIKSLSESDIDDLQNGKGWGLAKAAELNGVPGPIHLLEMKEEIALSKEQVERITALYEEMKKEAKLLGEELIMHERELNDHFANGTINAGLLKGLLVKIEGTRMKLRYVHLSTHLKTPAIVTEEQVKLYNKLRGY